MKIEKCVGADVNITCNFPKVKWFYSQTSSEYKEDHAMLIINGTGNLYIKTNENWSRLTIKEVILNNSGWYFCEVTYDIPLLMKNYSNGAHLIICK